jgi:radical SAM protein with 4Fe4S-binding SPASM domain
MSVINRALKKINKTVSPGKLFFTPEYLILGVNNVCNLHCKMCDVGTQNMETNFAQNLVGSHPINMPLELFKKIVDEAAQDFPNVKIGYAFTEPLVYPYLRDSLIYAKEKGIKTTVTTNALNLNRKAQDLIDGNVSELYISLDGLEKTHNYIRGNEKSFQKAIEGIEYLQTFDTPPEISVFCVITEWNYNQLKEFADYFKNLPIKHVGFMHQNFITSDIAEAHNVLYGNLYKATHSNIEETDFTKIDLTKLNNEIAAIKNSNYPFKISFSPEIEGLDILKKYYLHPEIKLGRTCNDVFTNVMIKTDGSIIPSHGRCYNSSMGNIYEKTLKDIWNDSPYAKFRNELVKADGLFPACNRCCSAF